ncbi:hypothetical protein DBR45_48945 [Pseudomonas sp. HMWF031]|nr:hypothetical protein DBR45_48945 [Pseudomonas sp. HMWF031]
MGASLLAMGVNDYAGCQIASGAQSSIASRLAPTGRAIRCYKIRTRSERPLILPSFRRCRACLAMPRSTAT